MLFGACGCGVCCGGTAICDIKPATIKVVSKCITTFNFLVLTMWIVRLSFATILHCVIKSWSWLVINTLIRFQLTVVRSDIVKSSVKLKLLEAKP